MSISKKIVTIFENLPSGGAKELFKYNFKFIKQRSKIIKITELVHKPKNIFDYLYTCLFILPVLHKRISVKIIKNTSVLLAYHSWLTKSPYILRYSSIPKIYICQEVMREYYDQLHIANQNMRERIINIIRTPIKIIDRNNLKSENLTVVANSYFSKKIIDKSYKVDSYVIYPGVNTKLFKINNKIKKMHQVISVGAINKLKGYEFLIRAVSTIDEKSRPRFVIVGNGGDKKYITHLKSLAKVLKVKINILVNISQDDLILNYNRSQLFIYAPINEPFGIVVEEAMSIGLPLVVYKSGGGYVEILNSKNGVIIDNLNDIYWGNQISKLLKNAKKIKSYSDYNQIYVQKNYDQQNMNTNIWSLINSL